MAFQIDIARPDDIPELTRVYLDAFASDADLLASFGTIPPPALFAGKVLDFKFMFSLGVTTSFKAVDTATGAIAAFSLFLDPLGDIQLPSIDEVQAAASKAAGTSNASKFPADWIKFEGMTWSLIRDMNKRSDVLDSVYEKWRNRQTDYSVSTLAVRPSYRRHGLGSQLIQAGLNFADAKGAPVTVMASSMGLPLYLKLGFEKVEEIELDFGKYGLETETMLIRKPKSNTS